MKKIWTKPMATVEEFAANEYVAACWGISCDHGERGGQNGAADPINGNGIYNRHRKMNNGQGCGWLDNQAVTDRTGVEGQFTVIELNSPTGVRELPCTLYGTDSTYRAEVDYLNLSEIQDGMTIYWTTSNGGITWHHQGQIVMDDSHPNRS